MLLLFPSTTYAQRGRGRVYARPTRSVVVVGGFYAPYRYYDPFFGPRWWSAGYYGPYGYYGFQRSPYYGFIHDDRGALRLQVTPRQAEVYVDGYRAGTVDDFDGTFQRLNLPPGEHEIVLYLDGYRTAHQRVNIVSHETYRVRFAMEPLGPGETPDPRPVAPPPLPPSAQPAQRAGGPPPPGPGPGYGYPPSMPERGGPNAFGSLSIRVQPADAEILIDGEPWQTSGPADRLVVEVGEGRHRIEIRKDGFVSFSRDVDVRGGATETVNVVLSRADR